MGQWIDFDFRNSEFTDRDGNILGAGWLLLEMAGDGDRSEIESVSYVVGDLTGKGLEVFKAVPTHIADFVADWLLTDAAKVLVRQAYEDELSKLAENRSDDRGCFEYHQMRGAA